MHEDYFERKRAELGMDRGDALAKIQALLNEWYPAQVRAKRLHQGVLWLITPSASVAGELRMRQIELAENLDLKATRVSIHLGSLD